MVAEIERRVQAMMDTRRAVRSGEISMFDARREVMATREEGRERMIELIGEGQTEALQERLFGGFRPGGGPPPGL